MTDSAYLEAINSPAATEHDISDPADVVRHMTNVKNQIRNCTRCKLHEACTKPVPFRGPAPAPICLIGEAPGPQEDKAGLPFVGPSGKLLDELMLQTLGFDSTGCLVANAVSCYPSEPVTVTERHEVMGEVQEILVATGKRRTRAPWPREREACAPNLIAQIALSDAPVIVTLGRHALTSFRTDFNISQLHGKPSRWRDKLLFPVFHPAAGLRNSSYKRSIVADFSYLKVLLDHPDARWPEVCVLCGTNDIDFADDTGLYFCGAHAPTSVSRGRTP